MQQVTNIRGKKWTIGLDWEILPGEGSPRQEAKTVAMRNKTGYALFLSYGSNTAIGLAPRPKKEPSAAYALALANQKVLDDNNGDNYFSDWVVVEELGDEKYWMGVIKNGLPSPQYDAIFDITQIKEHFAQLMINDNFTVFSPSTEIQSFLEGQKTVDTRGLNELTSEVNTKFKYDKLLGIPTSVIYAFLTLLALALIAYAAYAFVQGRNLAEKKANLLKQQKAAEIAAQNQYEQEMKAYEEQKVKAKADAENGILIGLSGVPMNIISSWYNTISNHPLGTHGWNLKKIECYYDPKKAADNNIDPKQVFACDMLYDRTGLSTNRMFLQDYPNGKISGNSAVYSKLVPINAETLARPDYATLNTLPYAKDWGFDMVSQLQLLKIVDVDHEIKPSTDITYQTLPKPLTPKEKAEGKKPNAPETIPTGFAKGEVIVKSPNFEILRELSDNVDFKAVGVKKVMFNPTSSGIVWELYMDYYIKSDKGGMTGADSSALSNNAVPPTDTKLPNAPGQ